MEKLKYLFLSLLMAIFTVGFASCSSDDDDNNGSGDASSIVGTWEEQGGTEDNYTRLTFSADGTGYLTENKSGDISQKKIKYTYSFNTSDNTGALSFWFNDNTTIYNWVVTVTGQTMKMSSGKSATLWVRK